MSPASLPSQTSSDGWPSAKTRYLRAAWPALGDFDLAQQLQAIVDDRRTGVLVHAEQLRTSLTEIAKALHKVATDVENTDEGTAEKIRAVVANLRVRVREDIALLDGQRV